MQVISFSILTAFCLLILCSIHVRDFVRNGQTPTQPEYLGNVAISCGSSEKSIAADGRQWIGDKSSAHLYLDQPKAKSRSSAAADIADSVDPVPCRTARISAYEFRYIFQVKPGHKIIRLHFHPSIYTGFDKSQDFFTVKAGPFTLLDNFSASIAAETLELKHIVKEFCIKVEENGQLTIVFFPMQSSKSKENTYAFVNGIEIISIPVGLYFTEDGAAGALIVDRNYAVHVDDHTALETVQRLNTGGSTISAVEDYGLFRRWDADSDYLFNSFVHPSDDHAYTRILAIPHYIAPMRLYQTSWNVGRQRSAIEEIAMHSYTWKIPVDPGFAYLIRLHLCELTAQMPESGSLQFNILINNQIADTGANIMRWGGGNGIPVFHDYMEVMKGKKEGRKRDLFISLQSTNVLVVSLLNGIEVFKLSDLENSLASPNPVSRKHTSVFWMPKIQQLLLAFSRSHGNVAGMIILITFINAIVYSIRRLWEKNFQWEKDTGSASTEPSCHCFSLAKMRSATDNFSEVNVIGKGGFGKVYKGSIPGIPETLAIKRLNSNSKQGACEFWSEIETLSKLRHIHLVSLIGYCNESQEMILAYKYMHRGTLADNLYKNGKRNKDHMPLSWEQRLRICIGAARGLDYLHTGYGIIHRDVKDSNILLDGNLEAKISDFGLSKLEKMNHSMSYISTKVKGTYGYLDPDYRDTHELTRKSDVYSFGVVMLVVLSGRPVLDTTMPEELQSLVSSYRIFSEKGELEKIVDPKLQGKFSSGSLNIYVNSIEMCLQRQPKKRPTMAQVTASLENALFSTSEGGNVISPLYNAGANKHVHFSEDSLLPIREFYKLLPQEGIFGQPVCNASFPMPILGKSLKSGQKGAVHKQLWGRAWETLWSRGKPIKKKNMVPSDRSEPE